jgi:peptidoglycan/LPS O-acetylase OafA/YrhL
MRFATMRSGTAHHDQLDALTKERLMDPSAVESYSSTQAPVNHVHELAGIEVLRFLCAFAILIWHYPLFFVVGEVDDTQLLANRQMLPVHWLLQYLYAQGWCAVQIFWCISGFIFYWRYARQISDRRIGLVEFATRRFSRLYPLHIVTLILVAVLQYLYFRSHGQTFIVSNNSPGAFLAQLFFASNWFDWQSESFNGPIWSISVEILVYFSFFYTMRAIGANPIGAIVISGVGFALFYNGFLLFHMEKVCECVVLFFAGGAAQLLSKQRFALPGFACVGTAVVALLAADVIHVNLGVVAILTVCFVLSFARFGEMKSGSFLKHAAFLGNATYSSYLIHFPLQLGMVTIVDVMGYGRTVFFSPITLGIYLALVIVTSLAVFHWFEAPAQDWLRSYAFRASKGRLSAGT